MKIAYLSNSPLEKKVANAIHVMNMASSFAKNGHQIYLHAKCNAQNRDFLFDDYGIKNDFKLICVQSKNIKFLGPILYGLIQAFKARLCIKPDLCYSRCLLSAFFTMNLGLKSIVEFHEMPHSKFLKWLYRSLLRNKNLLRVVVISEGLKLDLVKEFEISNIIVAHDGATLSYHSEKFLLENKKEINIGYAGGLREGNGLRLMMDLANELPLLQFHIVGGDINDIEQWKTLQRSNNINWYGKREPKEVGAFLHECDILLAPYQVGPKTSSGRDTARWMSPLKIFEYMASRKAMVVSKFEVLEEVLNKSNAILVNPDDFLAWRSAIENLASNISLRMELGENAYNCLLTKYTWEKRAKAVLEGLLV
ncbi:glycosyltransferase [Sulfurospirillum barnesii]|uniref:Glycosyltransferase n=1 Tax=Sulfurospirillum barnesii (strain ATCC 700032 / DSM 10660 / SES-3) TaxID=760154 RepID=I3XYW5_SULBS|nr:glycosyltransferase [Sulfurospirillum barnesii]AFL69139.1 glycosyltransferase [Sulfurospirillum barnesii SES-3]